MAAHKILICGGGTGGHIFPGIAVWRAVKAVEPDSSAHWLLTDRGESKYLSGEGIPFTELWVAPLSIRPHTLVFFIYSVFQSLAIVRKFRPDVCLATGGYASAPGALACWLHHIPIVTLEINVVPGKATRLLARISRKLVLGFAETLQTFPFKNAVVLGIPIRSELLEIDSADALRRFGLTQGKIHLLVTGGSLGAINLNHAAFEAVASLPDPQRAKLEIVHQTGDKHEDYMKEKWQGLGVPAVVRAFFDDLPHALVAADIVIARAGATTVAEILAAGKPAILIPYPHAGAHQTPNARAAEAAGAAIVIEESDPSSGAKLRAVISRLLDSPGNCARMAAAARAAARPAAAAEVARLLLKITGH